MSEWVGHIRREGDVWLGEMCLPDLDWPMKLRGTVETVNGRSQLRITGKMGHPPASLVGTALPRKEIR